MKQLNLCLGTGRPRINMVNGMKPCSKCKRLLPREQFYKNQKARCGLHSHCRECSRKVNLDWCGKNRNRKRQNTNLWRKRNPRKVKSWQLFHKYGITIEEYDRLVAEQGSACSICGEISKLCVDHSHNNGAVRGLLCSQCNQLLGQAKERIEVLKSAILYLQKYTDR